MEKIQIPRGASPLAAMGSYLTTSDARAPQANLTNAGHLFGDPFTGDVDDDDEYGDIGDFYGDISTAPLDTYETLIGDVKPKKRRTLAGRVLPYAALGSGLTVAAITALKNRKKKLAATVAQNSRQDTINNQLFARRSMGKIAPTESFRYYSVKGATLTRYPLAPTEQFPADLLKYNFDRQNTDTPFESEVVQGTFAGVTWTLQANGVATIRYYTAVIINVGLNTLTGAPGTIFQMAGTFPTINGTLTVAATPWAFTLQSGFYARVIVFPWILVTNKPVLALGAYNTVAPIIVTLTGLPSTAAVSMIVPGSLHEWTIAMRNRLIRA